MNPISKIQCSKPLSPVLTILSVNYNTSDFIECMLYCLHKITHNPFKILIVDNFYSGEERLKLKKICSNYDNVETFFRKQSQSGSIGHGEALDILTEKVDTSYFAILDADATFLLKKRFLIKISFVSPPFLGEGRKSPPHHSLINYNWLHHTINYEFFQVSFLIRIQFCIGLFLHQYHWLGY